MSLFISLFFQRKMHRFNKKIHAANAKSSSSARESQRQNVWVVILSMVLVTTVSSIFALYYFGQGSQLLEAFKVENIQQLEMGIDQYQSAKATSLKSNFSIPMESPLATKNPVAETAKNNLRTSSNANPASKEKGETLSHSMIKAKSNMDEKSTTTTTSGTVATLPLTLVSLNKPVTSDVRGNLGPATVVTNEKVEDWLQDRWQAARNMQGEPIPGEHWIEIDLEGVFTVEKIVIDWEQAYSDQWSIMVRSEAGLPWKRLCVSKEAKTVDKNKMHIIQEVLLSQNSKVAERVRFAKLVIHRSSTMWGSSIWRFQIWDRPHQPE